MRLEKKHMVLGAGLLLGVGFSLVFYQVMRQPLRYFCRYVLDDGEIQQFKRHPIAVEAFTAKTEDIDTVLTSVGSIKAKSFFQVKSEIQMGVIKAIHFQDGDYVTKGDLLIEFNNEDAKSRVAEQKSRMEQAKDKYDRISALARKGAESQAKATEAEKEYNAAKGRYEYELANLEKTFVRAPFTGGIGIAENAFVGSVVQQNQDLVTLTEDSKVNLDVKFPAKKIGDIGLNQKIYVRVEAYPDKKFEGNITAIDSKVSSESSTILTRAEIDNSDGLLRHGMLGEAELVISSKEQGFLVPETAIRSQGEKFYMFLVKKGKAHTQEVVRGHSIGAKRVIRSGLSDGDVYIDSPKPLLTANSPIEIHLLDGKEPKAES